MSEIATTGPVPAAPSTATGKARAAIARAAQATGVDFDFLLAQAKLESGLDPEARASTSSATGLYQFIGGTWLDTLKKHGAEHGLDWASAAAADPARRGEIMALRRDPQVSALMAAELAGDNQTALTGTLGRAPDSAELYLAHFLGSQGATRFLTALQADPARSAASVAPGAAAANRTIFFERGGAPRSLGEVMDLIRGRLSAAMEGGSAGQWADFAPPATAPSTAPPQFAGGPVAQAFHAAAANAGAQSTASGQSMADTLRETFNVGGPGDAGVPAHVRATYTRLAALGF